MTFNAALVLSESYPAFFRNVFCGETSQFAAYMAFRFSLPFPKLPGNDVRKRRRHDERIWAGRSRRYIIMSRYCGLQISNNALYGISRFLQGEATCLNIPASV